MNLAVELVGNKSRWNFLMNCLLMADSSEKESFIVHDLGEVNREYRSLLLFKNKAELENSF